MILKIRHDYVTNSSSSSFIISRDAVTYDKLVDILLEIANKEAKYRGWEEGYTFEEDVSLDTVAYRYRIEEATLDNPHTIGGWWPGHPAETFNNHFVIDNDSNIRYNWEAVEEVLSKHNIPWKYGDCD